MALHLHEQVQVNNPDAKTFNEELFVKAWHAMDKTGDGHVTNEELKTFFLLIAEKWGML
jgi:hypothetical protein